MKFFTHPSSVYKQTNKIAELKKLGYIWDNGLSIAYCAVVLRKNKDLWVFGLDGSIENNPNVIWMI